MAGKKFILPAVGLAVVLVGGVATYFYFNRASGDALGPQAIAKVIPDDAYMATYVSTDAQAWSKLQQFGTPEAQKIVSDELNKTRQQMMTEPKIDYDKDIKPWIGNAMIALLPSESQASSESPNMLVVVGIKDKVSALNFANRMKSESKVKATESDYKGVKIVEYAGQKTPSYTTVLNDYLLIAYNKKTIEQAIDTTKGEPSLASRPGADSLLSKGLDLQNPLARVYFPDYATAVQQLTAIGKSSSAPLPPQTLTQLKQVKSLVAGIGVDDAGLRLKALANLDPQVKTVEFKPAPGTIVNQFPGDTLALISGAGISRYWAQAVEGAKANPDTQKVIDQMRQQSGAVGLDLDKEIFGWMDGEFALAAIPSNQGLLSTVGFGGALVIDTSDRKTAEATLAKLDALVKNTGLSVGQRDVQGKQVTEWQTPQGAALEHGWLDQDSVFITIGPLASTVATKPSQSLDSADAFKAATASLPKQNVGYFYLDMDKTMTLVNSKAVETQSNAVPPETAAIFNSIRGIGVTSNQADKSTTAMELLLALKPAK